MARSLSLPDAPPLPIPDDLDTRLLELGVSLDSEKRNTIAAFLGRMLAMNAQMNLTSVTDPAAVWVRHVLDGLSLLPGLDRLQPGQRVADLGSGSGVPGVLLAIARPDLEVTLIEATQKKAAYLVAITEALKLGNVRVLAERAEALHRSCPGRFDVVVARAVARLVELIPLAAPLARRGGRLLLIKGEQAEAELADAGRIFRKYDVHYRRTIVTPTGRILVFRVGPAQAVAGGGKGSV